MIHQRNAIQRGILYYTCFICEEINLFPCFVAFPRTNFYKLLFFKYLHCIILHRQTTENSDMILFAQLTWANYLYWKYNIFLSHSCVKQRILLARISSSSLFDYFVLFTLISVFAACRSYVRAEGLFAFGGKYNPPFFIPADNVQLIMTATSYCIFVYLTGIIFFALAPEWDVRLGNYSMTAALFDTWRQSTIARIIMSCTYAISGGTRNTLHVPGSSLNNYF